MTDSPVVPQPKPYSTPAPIVPPGNRIVRGLSALARGRLPYALQQPWDRFCVRRGNRFKTIEAAGLKIRLRRQTADEAFIYTILELEEYTPAPHYSLRRDDCVIDIGGNIGVFAMHAAIKAPKGRIFTFEPISENYQMLVANLKANGLTNVTPHHMAVVGRNREIKIYTTPVGHEATGSHSIFADMAGGETTYEIPHTITLAEVFERYGIERCNLLKVDCEGAEYEIMEALPSLYYQRIERVVMEWHARSRDPKEKFRRIEPLAARLLKEGFEIDDLLDGPGFKSGFLRARRR